MQGMPTGVLWLLLWCLVVEASIARLSGSEIHIQAYAMTFFLWWENSQTKCKGSCNGSVIRRTETWYEEVGLSVSPDKTECVVFTRRRTPRCL